MAVAVAVVTGGLLVLPSGAASAVAAADGPRGEWWWSAMGVDELHEHGTGEGITVAVVDGPLDPSAPELEGKVASSWTPCLDPRRVADPAPRSPSSTGAEAEHATSMAALIAGTGRGTGPGGRGIRGIAPDATIRHYAVLYDDPTAADGIACGVDFPDGDDVDRAVGRSIARAAQDGADVINLSLVTGYSEEIEDGLLAAYRAGAVVVAGTGNAATKVEWPGLGNGVVLVNPVGRDGEVTDFAVTDSDAIGLAAPGEDVMAGSDDAAGWDSTALASGASVATALTSGAVATVWSAHPDASAGQVLQALKQNVGLRATDDGSGYRTWFRRVGDDLPQVRSKNAAYGWGVVDPADAVLVDPTTLPTDNPFVRDGTGVAPTAADVAAATAAATGTAPSSTPATTATTAPAGAAAAPTVADDATDGSGTARWGAFAAALVAVGAGGWLLVQRLGGSRRRGADDPTGAGEPAPPTTANDPTETTTSQGAVRAEGRNH